jgi:hypothetical protein
VPLACVCWLNCAGRFHRLMSTKSLVLKSTLFPEWFGLSLLCQRGLTELQVRGPT